MKRLLALLLVLTICIATVSGCSAKEKFASHTYGDLTISLPVNAVDLSAQYSDFDFLFGCGLVTVGGIREDRALLQAHGIDTVQQFTELLIHAHQLECQPLKTDGITYFNYEAGQPQQFTYVVTVWETADAFWSVQAYCRAEDYATVRDIMWQYLRSTTV